MLRTVLLPTDFSQDAEAMLSFARGLPALGVRRVVLAHVVDPTGLEGPVIAARVDDVRGRLRELAGVVEGAGLHVETRIATGIPQDEILSLEQEDHVDAVVCGTHGRGVVDEIFLSTVSDHLARARGVPRLVVRFALLRNAHDPATICSRFGSKLLVAVDFSASSQRAFETALTLPPHTVGAMFLVHAIDPSLAGDKRRAVEEGARFQLRNWSDIAREHGIPARPVITPQEPSRAILVEADERRVTGIMVGTRGRSPLQEAMYGSVSMTLLRQASCPVMVVS